MSQDIIINSDYEPLIDESHHTIGEVSSLINIPQHVLRFWETKFSTIIKPIKNRTRRYYSNEDIEILLKIKDLLYDKGYTIKGVQNLLANNSFDIILNNHSEYSKKLTNSTSLIEVLNKLYRLRDKMDNIINEQI